MDEETRSGALDPTNRELILAMVGSARTLPPAERAAWLDRVCGVDSALRAELESLLADSDSGATKLMSSPAFDVAAISSNIVPGQTIGQYRIVEKLGQGGMGAVYKAIDQRLGRTAAVKVIAYSSGRGVEQRRFFREAQAASALNHPNIVTIYEYNSDRGLDYMAMEYIDGKTLARLMDDPDLRMETRIGYACQVAAALGKAHEAGIVHRDLKPANIMVTGDGQVKVLDFGLASQAYPGGAPAGAEGETLTGLTAVGAVVGTPAYMSPEQAVGEPLDHRSDIFSFGIVLYELLCGRHPFPGKDRLETLSAIVRREPASTAVLNPAIPTAISAVIERCLQKDRAARPQSATGIRTDLLAAWDSSRVITAAKASRFRAWMLAPAGAAIAMLLAVPLFRSAKTNATPVATVQDDYQKAHDLLDRYYRPRALETAIPLLENITARAPRFAPAFADLGRANAMQFIQTSDTRYVEPARRNSLEALKLQPDLASAHVTLGILFTQSGRNELASQELDEALRLDKFNAAAYGALGDLRKWQGRNDEVEPNLQQALSLAPDDWRIMTQLGQFHTETGKLAEAAADYGNAARLVPDNPRAQNNLGTVYRLQNRLPEAEAAFRKAISIEPTFGRYRNLGQVLLESGNDAEAERMLQKSIELKPGHYRAWGFLATAYSNSGADRAKVEATYRKAISLAEELRKQTPTEPYLLADIGGYYAALGERSRSEPLLRQAGARSSGDAEILYEVATGYEILHQRDIALMWMEKAIAAGMLPQFLERIPRLSALRADPRYRAFIGKPR
jgi:tetratricopeptide (TPR) repeat protein/predicted Ser/Thr protein kinase